MRIDSSTPTEMHRVLVELASNLKRYREVQGYSAEELARKAKVSQEVLSGIESMKLAPRLDALSRLAAALEVPVAELLKPRLESSPTHSGVGGPSLM